MFIFYKLYDLEIHNKTSYRVPALTSIDGEVFPSILIVLWLCRRGGVRGHVTHLDRAHNYELFLR